LTDSGATATVHSFSDERKPFGEIPIGTIATSWTCGNSGETFLLLFPESLYFGKRLSTTLLCPNQIRDYGITVHDTPRRFDPTSKHAIITDDATIPLQVDGVISYFNSSKPTTEQIEDCRRIILTSDTKWNPRDPEFQRQENAVNDLSDINVSSTSSTFTGNLTTFTATQSMYPEWFDIEELCHRMVSCVYITLDDISAVDSDDHVSHDISAFTTNDVYEIGALTTSAKPKVTKEILARRWGIGLKAAAATLQSTTQRGMRSFLHPIDRRLSTSQPHLAYPILKRKMYSDTMFSKSKSLRSNTCAQVWTDGMGYSLFYPLKSKSLAWTTVSTMISDINAIPMVVITDGAAEETGGPWKKEMQHYRIKQQWSEPYSQWQNRAESEIRELKRIIRKTVQRSFAPKRLWDFCGQWAAAVRRRTSLELPGLEGRTPEENLHARVVDISAYAQFDFYALIWYIDYPQDVATPRRQLG
jgi:hypothetical protein